VKDQVLIPPDGQGAQAHNALEQEDEKEAPEAISDARHLLVQLVVHSAEYDRGDKGHHEVEQNQHRVPQRIPQQPQRQHVDLTICRRRILGPRSAKIDVARHQVDRIDHLALLSARLRLQEPLHHRFNVGPGGFDDEIEHVVYNVHTVSGCGKAQLRHVALQQIARPRVHHLPRPREQQHAPQRPQHVRAWLVDAENDAHPSIAAQARDDVDHLGRVRAVQARRRLVKEHEAGAHEQLHPNAYAPLLPPRQPPHKLVSDHGVHNFAEPELGDHLPHPRLLLSQSRLPRQAQHGVEQEVFPDCGSPRENDFLSDVPREAPHLSRGGG